MGPVRGASDGQGPAESCDFGPSRARASSRGPRPAARSPIGCAGSSRRGRCPAVGIRPPALGGRRPRRRRSGRSGALAPDVRDRPEVAADRLDPGGGRARRGSPLSSLQQVDDIRVLRGSTAASCKSLERPRGRGIRRYAAYHGRYPATSDAESRRRNSPGASVRHPANGLIAVVLEPATPTDSDGTGPTAQASMQEPSPFSGSGASYDLTLRGPRSMSERLVRWMPARRTPPASGPAPRAGP